jgi:predicted permease
MLTTTASAVPYIKQGRARALCAAGGALAAVLAWIVEVPLLGIHLNVRFGPGHMHMGADHIQTIAIGQVIGVTVAASLFGWLLLALLERRTPHARLVWTATALAALAASLALPLALATTTSAAIGLIVMHVTVAAVVIPAMAHTARSR